VRLRDVLCVLRTYRLSDGSTPGYGGAADILDVLDELARPDDRPASVRARRPRAGGLDLLNVDIAHIVRIGLEETITAHAVVEAQRAQRAPAIAAQRKAAARAEAGAAARAAWEASG
jgi:hypothetical protein